MTNHEAHSNADELDSSVPVNSIDIISDEILVPDEMNVDSPNGEPVLCYDRNGLHNCEVIA